MQLKNLTSGNYLAVELKNYPTYTDKISEIDGVNKRVRSLSAFNCKSQIENGSQIQLIDDSNNNRIMATFTVNKKYRYERNNYYKADDIIESPGTGENKIVRFILGSYDWDGEIETFETPIINNNLSSYDYIVGKEDRVGNKNELNYNFESGIITIKRNI